MMLTSAITVAPMVMSLAKSYGITAIGPATLNIWFKDHFDHLKASEIEAVSQVGTVLDGATAGFGIGYFSSTAVIAAGQLMLGNTLEGAVAVGSSALFSNPVAATCASIGAVYYGYHALSDEEREKFLSALEDGLEVGKEFIKSLISYVETSLTRLVNSETLQSLRAYVSEYAAFFGKNIADITRSVSDRAILLAHQATTAAYDAAASVGSAVYSGAAIAGDYGGKAGSAISTASSDVGKWANETSIAVRDRVLSYWQSDDEVEK